MTIADVIISESLSIQGDVALNLYDFVVRRPNKLAEKYGLRAYDEIILAPMVRTFVPR
jgi:actin-related protein 8